MATAKSVSKERLVKAVKELNDVLGLDPQIDVTLEEDALVRDLLEAAELLVPEDVISKATLNVINDLEVAQESDQEAAAGADVTDAVSTDNEPEGEESAPVSEDTSEADPQDAPEKTAEKAAKEEKAPRDNSRSNKAIVYLAWKQDGIEDEVELGALVENRVKDTTIKVWISQWKKGNNLPAIAKELEA
jgi:hypothetical protein